MCCLFLVVYLQAKRPNGNGGPGRRDGGKEVNITCETMYVFVYYYVARQFFYCEIVTDNSCVKNTFLFLIALRLAAVYSCMAVCGNHS